MSARWFSATSLAVLAIATLGAALAQGPLALALCLALYGPASGCALSVAEGLLVESDGASRERSMARVTLAAALGDLAVPALLALLAALGLGWRTALALAAAVAALLALFYAGARALDRPLAKENDEDEGDAPTISGALALALRTRPLLAWSLAGTLTGLLDEVLVAFAAIHLAGLSALARSVALAAWIGGGIVGLAWLERRVERLDPQRVLLLGTVVCAAAILGLARTHDAAPACGLLALIGATSSTFHPLVKARAYASLPGRPALVNAVASALVPLDALAPLVLGAIAVHFGASAAVMALVIAPAGIFVMAWVRPAP